MKQKRQRPKPEEERCMCPGEYDSERFARNGTRRYIHHPDCRPHDPRKVNDPTKARTYMLRMKAPTLWDYLDAS